MHGVIVFANIAAPFSPAPFFINCTDTWEIKKGVNDQTVMILYILSTIIRMQASHQPKNKQSKTLINSWTRGKNTNENKGVGGKGNLWE